MIPTRRLPPPAETPTWCCSCEVHRATLGNPLCPVCLDDETKGAKK